MKHCCTHLLIMLTLLCFLFTAIDGKISRNIISDGDLKMKFYEHYKIDIRDNFGVVWIFTTGNTPSSNNNWFLKALQAGSTFIPVKIYYVMKYTYYESRYYEDWRYLTTLYENRMNSVPFVNTKSNYEELIVIDHTSIYQEYMYYVIANNEFQSKYHITLISNTTTDYILQSIGEYWKVYFKHVSLYNTQKLYSLCWYCSVLRNRSVNTMKPSDSLSYKTYNENKQFMNLKEFVVDERYLETRKYFHRCINITALDYHPGEIQFGITLLKHCHYFDFGFFRQFVDWQRWCSKPFFMDHIAFVTRTLERHYKFFKHLPNIFSMSCWSAFFVTCVLVIVSLKILHNELVTISIFEYLYRPFLQYCISIPRKKSFAVLIVILSFMTIVIYTAFNAKISELAVIHEEEKIPQTWEELAKSEYVVKTSVNFDEIRYYLSKKDLVDLESVRVKIFKDIGKSLEYAKSQTDVPKMSPTECVFSAIKNKYICIRKSHYEVLWETHQKYIDAVGNTEFTIQILDSAQVFLVAMSYFHPIYDDMDKCVSQYTATGIHSKNDNLNYDLSMIRNTIKRRKMLNEKEYFKLVLSKKRESLSLKHLKGVFTLLAVCILVCFKVIILEILVCRYSHSNQRCDILGFVNSTAVVVCSELDFEDYFSVARNFFHAKSVKLLDYILKR